MESCCGVGVVQQQSPALEDPDSRDSGISLAHSQQSCSSLATAVDRVELDDDCETDQNTQQLVINSQLEDNTLDEGAFVIAAVDRSPLKKRLRSSSRLQQQRPTDFSSLVQSESNQSAHNSSREQQDELTDLKKVVPIRKCQHLGPSRSLDQWVTMSSSQASFSSSTYGTSSSGTSTTVIHRSSTQNSLVEQSTLLNTSSNSSHHHHNQSSLLQLSSTTSTAVTACSDNELPACVRAVHRVHSSSVLERSWGGSPDAYERYSLITVERPQVHSAAFRSIDADTMANLLESLTKEQFLNRFVLIDCRYPYEYDGGHIWYAVNVWESNGVVELFYPEEEDTFAEINSRIPIFYCEFSQMRGPKMAQSLREQDRNRNVMSYPYVDYKEIYVLDKGYKHFFGERQFSKYCIPQSYISMTDAAFTEQLKRYDSHHRRRKKRRRN